MEVFFGADKISNTYLECLKFLIFFGGEWLMLGLSLSLGMKEK